MGGGGYFYFYLFIYFIYFFFIALLMNRQERPTSSAILKAFLKKNKYPITAGWTGGAGRRQMEIRWKNARVGLELGT